MKNTYAMRIRGAFHTSTHRKIFKVGEIKAKDNFISYCVQLNSVKYTHIHTQNDCEYTSLAPYICPL